MVTKGSARFEKHQTIEILLMVDFLRIFKMLHSSFFFRDFLNSPECPGKIVKCT